MRFFLISLLIILTFFLKSAHSDVVNDIKIIGNDRVNSKVIEIFGKIEVGKNYNDEDLNEVLKNLYQTGFFSEVILSIDSNILLINVIENPIIQNLIINGVKNKDVKKRLFEIISLKENNPYTDFLAEKSLKDIKTLLSNLGYYFSDVTFSKLENSNKSLDLIVDITLNDKAYIKSINFIGDKKYKKRKLMNVITSEENKFWKFISKNKLLNQARLELDKRLLLNFYRQKGYYNVKIQDDFINFNEIDKSFDIIFNINAGEIYNFGRFEIEINNEISENDKINIKEFEKNFNKDFSGKKYSIKLVENILDDLEKFITTRDYEFFDINLFENVTSEKDIDIRFNLTNNNQNVFVKRINIYGNDITIEDVIRNELILDEGDPLNKVLYSKSINNINSLNIFKEVKAEIADTDNELEKNINITVSEKATGEISIGAGVGTSGASTSFGIAENNFLGKGIKLNTNLFLSEENIRGLFSYEKKNFRNTDRSLIANIESQETDRMTDFGYKSTNTGILLGTNFELFEDLFFSPKISLNHERLKTSSDASSSLQRQKGSYQNLNYLHRFLIDKRDQSFQPSDGYTSSFSQTIPVNIGDNQTLINSYELNTYHEYISDQTLSLAFYTSVANSIGNKDVRISERLYIPSKKLRGFEFGKIGPKDGEDYIGGNYVAAFNAKANLPIFQSMETLDFNLFYDAANVWGVDYSSSIADSSKIRSATGVGIDWFTPVGPMTFSLAQPLTKMNTDKTEEFRFQLGTTF